jgi:hypothetical protein
VPRENSTEHRNQLRQRVMRTPRVDLLAQRRQKLTIKLAATHRHFSRTVHFKVLAPRTRNTEPFVGWKLSPA